MNFIKNQHNRNYKSGFTIVELLIVIVVIAILAIIAILSYTGVQTSAGVSALKADLKNAKTTLEVTKVKTGNYPLNKNNLPVSDETNYDYESDGTTFCITVSSDRVKAQFYISSVDNTIQEGTCADGPLVEDIVYSVGDTGPAGGIVFYNKGNADDGWQYLEVAPDILPGKYEWGCRNVTVSGADGSAIGTGKQNTADIVAQGCSPNVEGNLLAAVAADEYSVGGYDDWFLPSIDEIYELYLQRNLVNNYTSTSYWSSTESADGNSSALYLYPNGSKYTLNKLSTFSVRAIRSF